MDLQAREKGYDLEANLPLLKLYQFNPTHTNMAVVVQVVFLFNFQEGAENDQKAARKKSLTDRFKTRILKSDPRSASVSEGLDRTPIAVKKVRHPREEPQVAGGP